MRFLNIFIGLVILICIIFVSYSHTVLLFNSVGFFGWKAHLATIAVEATFILSCFNLVVSRLKKYRPGFFAVAGFFYGSGITAWSNVSFSYEYGIAGRILGFAIPVGLWIAEGIISHSLLRKPTSQVTDQPNDKVVDQLAEMVVESNQPTNKAVESVVDGQPSTKKSANQPTKNLTTTKKTNQNSTSRKKSANQVVEKVVETDHEPANQEETQPTATKLTSQDSTSQVVESANQMANQLDEEERIKKAYFDYLNEHGEPPTQRKWAEKAGVSRYKISRFIEKHEFQTKRAHKQKEES